ncbi:hypothetical protein ACHAQJ_001538 [Trichoderma viride]
MELSKLAIIMSFLSGALATQENAAAAEASPSVRVCKAVNFGSPCSDVPAPLKACIRVPSGYNDQISAVKPNIEAGNCRFYRDYNCKGPTFDSEYPGFDNIYNQLNKFNDQISSFKCFGRVPA